VTAAVEQSADGGGSTPVGLLLQAAKTTMLAKAGK